MEVFIGFFKKIFPYIHDWWCMYMFIYVHVCAYMRTLPINPTAGGGGEERRVHPHQSNLSFFYFLG